MLFAVAELSFIDYAIGCVIDSTWPFEGAIDKIACKFDGLISIEKGELAGAIPPSILEFALKAKLAIKRFDSFSFGEIGLPLAFIGMVSEGILNGALSFEMVVLEVALVVFPVLEDFSCVGDVHLIVDRAVVDLL